MKPRPQQRARQAARLVAAALLLLSPAAAQHSNPSTPSAQAQQAISLPPSVTETLEREDYAAAAKALEDFLFLQTGHREAMFQLAFCYSHLSRRADAMDLYRELLELDPGLFEARVNLGVLLMEAEKPEQAAAEFQKATALQPESFRAQFYYARALEQAEDPGAAMQEYARAVRLDPHANGPRRAVAHLIRNHRDQPKFASLLDELLALVPTDAGLVELRAELFRLENKREEALRLYEKHFAAADEKLTIPTAEVAGLRYRAGLLAQELGRFEEALQHQTLAGKIGGQKFEQVSVYGRARALAALERYQEAIPLYRRALELMGDDVDGELFAELGFILFQEKQYREAIPVLVRVINLYPKREEAYNQLALALHESSSYPATIKILERRARVVEENPATLFLRAITHDKLGQCAPAIEFYEKFLARNTDIQSDQYFQSTARRRALKKTCRKARQRVK